MKQLTVFVNRDLEPQVLAAFDHAGIEGFLRLGEASGNRFLAAGEVPRTIAWEAIMFVVPAVEEGKADRIAAELADAAADCGAGPCLRVVAVPAEVMA